MADILVFFEHCAVKVNESAIFMIGGQQNNTWTNKTWIIFTTVLGFNHDNIPVRQGNDSQYLEHETYLEYDTYLEYET